MTRMTMVRSISRHRRRSGCASRGSSRRSSAGTRKLALRSLESRTLHPDSRHQGTSLRQEPRTAAKVSEVEAAVAAHIAATTSRITTARTRQAAVSHRQASLVRESCMTPTTPPSLVSTSKSVVARATALLGRHRHLPGTGRKSKSSAHHEDPTAPDEEALVLLDAEALKRNELIVSNATGLELFTSNCWTTTRRQFCQPAGPPSRYPSSFPCRHR